MMLSIFHNQLRTIELDKAWIKEHLGTKSDCRAGSCEYKAYYDNMEIKAMINYVNRPQKKPEQYLDYADVVELEAFCT